MKVGKALLLLVVVGVANACAQRELRAPCGPLTAYAETDCGEAAPVNEPFPTPRP